MTDRFARIPSRVAGIRDLGARDLRILIAIAAHADVKGRAFPSLARIAALTGLGLDRSKVPPCIRKLVAAGLLRTSHRRDEFGDAASTVYEILFDDAGVLPLVGTSAAAGGNTVLPLVGTRGVAVAGTLTDHSFNRPPNRHARRPSQRRVVDEECARWFAEFWRSYPSRHSHANPEKPARAKFEAALKRGIDPAEIIRGAHNYRLAIDRAGTDPRYVAQAQTWLHQERWAGYQQEPEPTEPQAGMV